MRGRDEGRQGEGEGQEGGVFDFSEQDKDKSLVRWCSTLASGEELETGSTLASREGVQSGSGGSVLAPSNGENQLLPT